jgi:hypothetical protein
VKEEDRMTQQEPPRAQICHALAHRVRVRAPILAGRRALVEQAARALAAAGAFARVTARPETGSFIVEDPDVSLDAPALARRIEEILRDLRDDEGRPLTPSRPEDHPGPTRIARAVVHAVAGINTDVRAVLDDRADLATILPVLFAAGGLRELAVTGRMTGPSWFNLLWWSLRSFMTFNIRAVEEEVEPEPDHMRPGYTEAL